MGKLWKRYLTKELTPWSCLVLRAQRRAAVLDSRHPTVWVRLEASLQGRRGIRTWVRMYVLVTCESSKLSMNELELVLSTSKRKREGEVRRRRSKKKKK